MQRNDGSGNTNIYTSSRYCQEQSLPQNRHNKSFTTNLPINLKRKVQREQRYERKTNETKAKSLKVKKRKIDAAQSEHDALVQATELEMKRILEQTELLSDIPYDCTPDELMGEIALANGHGTIVYIKRDGLSTLTIVLPQVQPTIANLKRAIESTARVQLKRELRERHEERMRRRNKRAPITTKAKPTTALACEEHNNDQQVAAVVATGSSTAAAAAVAASAATTMVSVEPIKSTGELVYSTACSGHHHRPNVSWRFLWRAYALFNVDTNLPLNDENGRKLLSECGVENASTLKFCNREKYFGRKRQK